MCPRLSSINLIRYLLVWRVNGSLVWLPRCLSAEVSAVLGAIIAKRLPTSEARYWRKALAPWNEYYDGKGKRKLREIPEVSWPIEAILFAYPGKRTYGQGESILWELKLIGESADHGFFLEVILPAMEEAGYTSDPRWNRPNKLWGRFDIHSVYVARGLNWEPLVNDGRLDLRYRASPVQWAEGLTFGPEVEEGLDPAHAKFSSPTRLTWLTPFDLEVISPGEGSTSRPHKKKASIRAPTLQHILEALMSRMSLLRTLRMEEQSFIQDAMKQADHIPILHRNIKNAPKDWPGRWIGTQIFSHIPSPIIPYLELASILHIGRQTHFGCGTFVLIRSTSDLVC
jgi:hypothetical protein